MLFLAAGCGSLTPFQAPLCSPEHRNGPSSNYQRALHMLCTQPHCTSPQPAQENEFPQNLF